ncbi:hypothetical protein NE237_010280 [Protea cynaroides]|uniref:Uncharacterized protein n=1 Tax=Protea cynaroides TaxID=273540 RepID=A0A9Q0R1I7_9MAGN|nr:hypothetical protein NE237_010280 [Protea cynaroides]
MTKLVLHTVGRRHRKGDFYEDLRVARINAELSMEVDVLSEQCKLKEMAFLGFRLKYQIPFNVNIRLPELGCDEALPVAGCREGRRIVNDGRRMTSREDRRFVDGCGMFPVFSNSWVVVLLRLGSLKCRWEKFVGLDEDQWFKEDQSGDCRREWDLKKVWRWRGSMVMASDGSRL